MVDKKEKYKDEWTIPIFSMKLSSILMQKGHALLGTSPNKKDKTKIVFYFKQTPEIHEAILEYTNSSKSKSIE